MADGRKLVKTKTPGVYKRVNGAGETTGYVVVYYVDGKQRKAFARTYDLARIRRGELTTQVHNDEYRPPSKETLADYGRRIIAAYQGTGRGFRERTRRDYSRDFERYVVTFFGAARLTTIRREDVRGFVAWLIDDRAQAERHRHENDARRERAEQHRLETGIGARDLAPIRDPGRLSDRTVERIVAVLKIVLGCAVDDELRRDNPASRVALPKRDPLPDPDKEDDGDVKALTRAELAAFLAIVRPDWGVFFRLLGATGLRISEALALDVRHLVLDGSRPHLKVRRAIGPDGFDRPKSKYGVRDIPLPQSIVYDLRAHVAALPALAPDVESECGRLVFASPSGTPKDPNNLRRKVLKPAAEEADVAWAGFHAFRHTFASMHIERGTNIVRLSRLLGHHKASFTLDVYSHMLDDGYGDPLDLDAELGGRGNDGATGATDTHRNALDAELSKLAA